MLLAMLQKTLGLSAANLFTQAVSTALHGNSMFQLHALLVAVDAQH